MDSTGQIQIKHGTSRQTSAVLDLHNESHTNHQEESVNTNSTRNPVIPSIFIRQVDPTTGQPTSIYTGPSSPNHLAIVHIIDLGHGFPLKVEYTTDVLFPDLDFKAMIEVADELAVFANTWNADTIFGANGDTPEVAA